MKQKLKNLSTFKKNQRFINVLINQSLNLSNSTNVEHLLPFKCKIKNNMKL